MKPTVREEDTLHVRGSHTESWLLWGRYNVLLTVLHSLNAVMIIHKMNIY